MIIVTKGRWCARCNGVTAHDVEAEVRRGRQYERRQTCLDCGKSRFVTSVNASKNGGNGDQATRSRRAKT
jgi:RNase P subunit RPR2